MSMTDDITLKLLLHFIILKYFYFNQSLIFESFKPLNNVFVVIKVKTNIWLNWVRLFLFDCMVPFFSSEIALVK